jgi:hypothetical protein
MRLVDASFRDGLSESSDFSNLALSGHLTMKEVERYTRMADLARNARAAMAGRV